MSASVLPPATEPHPPTPPHAAPGRAPRLVDPAWALVALITIAAAVLRLWDLGGVRLDPFYDAAVRSMGRSWHNFFFGAFEPGGSVSIDKPPVDLWLQVISTKLLGFNSTALKLPEALAGIAAVPLLFAAVRRVFGTVAGLSAAAALAVLPIEVLTSRSDTMDAVMMLLLVLGLLGFVHAGYTGRARWLYAGAAALGLAFNVKLLEAVIPLPALALLAVLLMPGGIRRRALQMGAASLVYLVVALSWLTATLLFPAHDRPFAIGSSNGSAWNAAFVFNGTQRVFGKPQTGDEPGRQGKVYPVHTQLQRDHIPITPPGPLRLLDNKGPLSGERLGLELLVALVLGGPALLLGLRRVRRRPQSSPPLRRGPPPSEPPDAVHARVLRAVSVGLLAWIVLGTVLFSAMTRLHPRYVEAFTPAVAAVLGVGVAWAIGLPRSQRLVLLSILFAGLVVYARHLEFGIVAVVWVAALGALAALAALALPRPAAGRPRSGAISALCAALVLVPILAVPARTSIYDVGQLTSDAGNVGALRSGQLSALSRFLTTHQGGARYEAAAASATRISSLIVRDDRPMLVLTSYNARELLTVSRLAGLVRQGAVRYAILGGGCGRHTPAIDADCSAPARWVSAHGTDISQRAGLPRRTLYALPSR